MSPNTIPCARCGRGPVRHQGDQCPACTEMISQASGYRPCACRDCFEIAIGTEGAMCSECEDAGCGGAGECERADAYDAA